MAKETPKALGVIPARGGSKRLPRKNILSLHGKPLVAWTIEAAQNSDLLTDFLVSSEDDEIIEIAKEFGAPVPFKRPSELALDHVRNVETIKHALAEMERIKQIRYDIIVLLQPTCPIRDPAHIDEMILRLSESELPTAASVKGPFKKRCPVLKAVRDNILEDFVEVVDDEVEPFYVYNASLYAVKREHLLNTGNLFSKNQVPVVMDRLHSLDIDTAEDFALAEAGLKYLDNLGWRAKQG